MGRIWSDQRRYESWLRVEIAAAEAMAAAGTIPVDAAREIRDRGGFDGGALGGLCPPPGRGCAAGGWESGPLIKSPSSFYASRPVRRQPPA